MFPHFKGKYGPSDVGEQARNPVLKSDSLPTWKKRRREKEKNMRERKAPDPSFSVVVP